MAEVDLDRVESGIDGVAGGVFVVAGDLVEFVPRGTLHQAHGGRTEPRGRCEGLGAVGQRVRDQTGMTDLRRDQPPFGVDGVGEAAQVGHVCAVEHERVRVDASAG